MATSVEEQVVTTHGEDHMITASEEDHTVTAPSEDQTITPPTEDHIDAPSAEEHIDATVAEEHNASVAEEHNASVAEEHMDATVAEEHIDATIAEEHIDVTVAEEHNAIVAEEHNVIVAEEHNAIVAEEHNVAIVAEEHNVAMIAEEHDVATIAEEHMDHMVDTTIEDHMINSEVEEHMGTAHIDDHMVTSPGEVTAMATHDEQKMSTLDEERLLITPYEEDKMITPYEVKTPNSYENNELANPETQPNKRRKKKSIVWEHFTIETVSAGCRRACCKQCKQTFAYSTGSKVAGTSHLKRHIAKGTCVDRSQMSPYTPGSKSGNSASEPPKRRYRTSSTPQVMFDAVRCRHEIARMIIMHEYPLHMVEHPGFLSFVQNLQPQFNMVSFNTIQGDCVATYLMEKQNLIKFIEGIPGRVCLALDMWTSSQSVGYVFITGHFIDSEWKSQRRLLNVVMEPYPDSDAALSHAVAVCLHDWSLENKLFSLTVNQPLVEAAFENLRPLLAIKNPLILNGQLLVGNCLARTFSSIVRDVLDEGKEIVKKVRESVKYVKTSDSHEEKFIELKQHLQVPSDKSLFIDDQTQWNTTYQMLSAASELKEVFSCLDTSDPDFKGAPTIDEWKRIEIICTYLKLIFDAANILTTTTSPTPITFFHEVWKIQSELARAVTSEDPFISSLTKRMQEKVDKYWKDCSLALATAVVMDPRFKMKLVEFSFNKIYGEEAPAYIKIVDDGVHELFHEYVALPLPLTPTYAEEGSGNVKNEEQGGATLLSDNGLTDFDVYIMETTNQQMKSELDQYLDESLLPRVQDFDVLSWWKLNKLKYPTLSKMARDILSIPVSTLPPDSVFSATVKEMDSYRSSLRPEVVEALICAKDWMENGTPDTANALIRMEF